MVVSLHVYVDDDDDDGLQVVFDSKTSQQKKLNFKLWAV